MQEKIKVSIICNTYNHEQYIEDALKGFVSQRTDFPFEVLIHDDASTDKTPEIIKKYEEMYPKIIKPIYQVENQFQQKIKATLHFQLPRAKGDYIAFCEGDDYWIDEYKLQKQFDLLEKHSEVNLCAHASYIEIDGLRNQIVRRSKKKKNFSTEEVIINDGDFFPTASLFLRKKVFDLPLRLIKNDSLDYIWQMVGSLEGGALFLPDLMSVYRLRTPGSWSSNMLKNSTRASLYCDRIMTMLDVFDNDTTFRYSHVIEFQKAAYLFNKGEVTSNKDLIKEAKKILCSRTYIDCYRLYILPNRLKKYMKYHFDWLVIPLKKARKMRGKKRHGK